MGTGSASSPRPNDFAVPPPTSAYPAATMPAYTYPASTVAYSGYPVSAYAPQAYSYYSPMVQSYPNYMYSVAPVDWYADPNNPDLHRPRERSRYQRSASQNNVPRSRGSREAYLPSRAASHNTREEFPKFDITDVTERDSMSSDDSDRDSYRRHRSQDDRRRNRRSRR